MKLSYKIVLDSMENILARRGLNDHGDAQKAVDTEVERLCRPYVPVDTGTLQRSPQFATDFGSGEVIYSTPYARKIYYTHKGEAAHSAKMQDPRAGKLWLERMKADNLEHLRDFAAAACGGK